MSSLDKERIDNGVHMKEIFIIGISFVIIFLSMLPALAVCDNNNYCKINSDGLLKFFVVNLTNNQPLTGSNCLISIYYTDGSIITSDNIVNEFSGGFYNYTISGSETNILGIHPYSLNCTKDGISSSYANSYEVVDDLSQNYFGNWNNWIYNIYTNVTVASSQLMVNILNYLQNQLTVELSQNTQQSVANKTWEVNLTTTSALPSSNSIWDISASKLRKYLGQ